MSGERELVAVAIDQDRAYAAGGFASPSGVSVRSWVSAAVPMGLDTRDGAAMGAWLGEELRKAGLGRARVVFGAGRGEVVIKRLRLPRPAGSSGEREIAGMVGLQMSRQMTVPMEGTAIDYVQVGESAGGEGAATTISVLAAALPGERRAWYEAVAEGAGSRLERIGLRPAGVAAILGELASRQSGPILGIALGGATAEFVVVEAGHLLFARSVELGGIPAADVEGLIQRVAVEAKRTWMSYRVSDESTVIDAVAVAGNGPLAREIAERCGALLEMPWKLLEGAALTELPKGVSEPDRLAAAALVGLLMESGSARAVLDFANPRRMPDRHAAKRQRVLAAALGLIVVGGVAWVLGSNELARLDGELKTARQEGGRLQAEYNDFLKDSARLEHVDRWTKANVDWLGHVRWLNEQMPDPKLAQLDQLSGKMGTLVSFSPTEGRYDRGAWVVTPGAEFSLSGKTRQKDMADDLRKRLVNLYGQVETKGPDVPNRFSFGVTSTLASPQEGAKPEAPRSGGVP